MRGQRGGKSKQVKKGIIKYNVTMNKTILILSIFAIIASGCGQRSNKQTNTTDVSQSEIDDINSAEIIQTRTSDFITLELDFGFKVTATVIEEFIPTLKLYEHFRLERNGNIIFSDSLLEFEFRNKLFPIVLRTGSNSFELLFEVNHRPSKNYLLRLFVSNDKLVGQDKLPTFEAKPIDINDDGIKEYAGSFNYFQRWGENYSLTTYNPILYYSVTETGLKLDSILTKQRNEIIYGQFYGFSYSEKYEIPVSVIENFEQELKLIKGER